MTAIAKAGHRSTVRRFESAEIDPSLSIGLAPDHPALTEGRTIFPTTVVGTIASPRFLVSGHNSPKLGKTVLKGPRTGWLIFHVTLEERATCPRSCHQWATCYGNAMPYSRRHRIDAAFLPNLIGEVATTARANPKGVLVRLHALGDFYSVEYVLAWAQLLAEWPQLHVFGYTARSEDADDDESRKIARVIRLLTEKAWDRFSIRFSRSEPGPGRSIVVDEDPCLPEVVVCPAQTKQTEACATCGLCWAAGARDKTIAFLRHGMKRSTGPRTPKAATERPSRPVLPKPAARRAKATGPAKIGPADEVAAKLRPLLPNLFQLHPGGLRSADVVALTGAPYHQVVAAINKLAAEGFGQWVPAGGEVVGKVLIAPTAPTPKPLKQAWLSDNQAALLRGMIDVAPDGDVTMTGKDLANHAGVKVGSFQFLAYALTRKGRLKLVSPGGPGRPMHFQILRDVDGEPFTPSVRPPAKPTPPGDDDLWTDELVAALTKAVADGLSAGVAAKALGVTRNAAISKASRLGLHFHSGDNTGAGRRIQSRIAREKAPKPEKIAKPAAPRMLRDTADKADPFGGIEPLDSLRTVALQGEPKSLLALRFFGECKYAVNDGEDPDHGFLFCAAKTADGEVYCDAHGELSRSKYQPAIRAEPTADRRRFNGRQFRKGGKTTVFSE